MAGALEPGGQRGSGVWDVMARARKRDVGVILTLAHKGDAEAGQLTFPLDATMVDVYQNCHAAVFLIDPSKKWTYEYVQRAACAVPEHVPTCILDQLSRFPPRVSARCRVGGGGGGLRGGVQRSPVPTVRRRDVASEADRYGLSALSTFLHPVLVSRSASLARARAEHGGGGAGAGARCAP